MTTDPVRPPKSPVRLRPLLESDLGRVMELEPLLFGAGAWSLGTYREELTTTGRTYVAAVVPGADGEQPGTDGERPGVATVMPGVEGPDAGDERLVGYAGLATGEEAQVMTVGVDAEHRRQGIGARLVGALVEAARTGGARTVLLEVRASDDGAQQLYARAGFVPIGRRRRYYRDGEDAVVMRTDLRRRVGPVGTPSTGAGVGAGESAESP